MHRHLFLLLLCLAITACRHQDPNTRDTAGEKSEWAILQAAEFASRSKHEPAPLVRNVQGYDLLIVPADENRNIWVMLNPSSPPFYKQLPAGRFSLPPAYVEQLVREHKVGYTVEQVLRSLAATP
jgi:hypothetical protein